MQHQQNADKVPTTQASEGAIKAAKKTSQENFTTIRPTKVQRLTGSIKANGQYTYVYIIILADLGALRAPLPAGTPDRWSRTNPNFEQTQSSNKSKLQTNPNFE